MSKEQFPQNPEQQPEKMRYSDLLTRMALAVDKPQLPQQSEPIALPGIGSALYFAFSKKDMASARQGTFDPAGAVGIYQEGTDRKGTFQVMLKPYADRPGTEVQFNWSTLNDTAYTVQVRDVSEVGTPSEYDPNPETYADLIYRAVDAYAQTRNLTVDELPPLPETQPPTEQ